MKAIWRSRTLPARDVCAFWGLRTAMLSGFNTNVHYRGVLFHVQTEDSGLANPHVITHLFHGGNIMASEKGNYAAMLQADDVADQVKALMESQHRAMLRRLKSGDCDQTILGRLGPDAFGEPSETAAEPPSPGEVEPDESLKESPALRMQRAFGERSVSGKPLDEVVLDYLVENARKRKRSAK